MQHDIKAEKFIFTKKVETLKLREKGYSYSEIGKIQKISINTVKSRVRRYVKKTGRKLFSSFAKRTNPVFSEEKKRIEKIISSESNYHRNCTQCGEDMILTKSNKRFCSDKCRSTWWMSHQECSNGPKSKTVYICKNCKNSFYSRGKERKYCSHDCYINARFRAYPDENEKFELNENFENALKLYKRGIACGSISKYLNVPRIIVEQWVRQLNSEFSNYSIKSVDSPQEWLRRISMQNPDATNREISSRIYLVCGKTNFGHKFDDLIAKIRYQLEIIPQNGDKFIFCGCGNTKIKIIECVGNSFLNSEKMLQYGTFPWPRKTLGQTMEVSPEDFQKLIQYSVKPWTKFFV